MSKNIKYFSSFFDYYNNNQVKNLTESYENVEFFDSTNIQFSLDKGLKTSIYSIIDLNQYLVKDLGDLDPSENKYIGEILRNIEKLEFVVDYEFMFIMKELLKKS